MTSPKPVFADKSLGASPVAGIIAANKTSMSTGTRAAGKRRGEPAEGRRDHDQARAAADGSNDSVGVLGEPGRVVIAGQVGREGVMAAPAQLPLDQVPVPSDIPAA